MIRLTDPRFVYTNSVSTNLAAKFKQIIAAQKKAAKPAKPVAVAKLKVAK